MRFEVVAAMFGIAIAGWGAIFLTTARRPMALGGWLHRLGSVLGCLAIVLLVILITQYKQGRDLFGMGCALPCMAGVIVIGVIAAIGNAGNRAYMSWHDDGGSGGE